MKKSCPLALIALIVFAFQLSNSSCTKTETKTVTVTDTVTVTKTVTDTIIQHIITYPISNLFLGKQWIVDSLFENYDGSNAGTLVYKRGAANNIQNLDGYIVIMWPDGTQFFINNGAYTTYTYSFRNSDSTELLLNNPNIDYARIVNLTETHLTIYDSTNSALSYYVYKP